MKAIEPMTLPKPFELKLTVHPNRCNEDTARLQVLRDTVALERKTLLENYLERKAF